MEFIGSIFALVLGAIFGSYATLFAYRLPRGESCFGRYFGKKSSCPRCHSIIKTRDLIPLINWLFTLGSCRNCKSPIPKTHLFIEASTAALFVICYLRFGFSEQFILVSLIMTSLVILLVTYHTHQVFPNSILNFILILSLLNRMLITPSIVPLVYSGVAGIVVAAFFYRFLAKDSDYLKFILIASLSLNLILFAVYFLIAAASCAVSSSKKFGYLLVAPLILLMLC